MPQRLLRPGINDSRAVCSLSDSGEIFYRRLMSIVDDYGRHEADPVILRAQLFARMLDRWPLERVKAALVECAKMNLKSRVPLVTLYMVDEKSYLQINNFGQQTRSASKCPAPDLLAIDSRCLQMLTYTDSDSESETESKTESKTESSSNARDRRPPARAEAPTTISTDRAKAVNESPLVEAPLPNPKLKEWPKERPKVSEPAPADLETELAARGLDENGIRQLWRNCRERDSQCTPAEILAVIDETRPRWNAPTIERPVAYLLTMIPIEFGNGGRLSVQRVRERLRQQAAFEQSRRAFDD